MTIEQYLQRDCKFYQRLDAEEFAKITANCPKRTDGQPYHSTPPNLGMMRMAFHAARMVIGRLRVLEIGYNLGHSRAILESFPFVGKIVSVDISTHAANAYFQQYSDQSEFILGDTKSPETWDSIQASGTFNLALIDGDHSVEGVSNDVRHCIAIGIRHFVFDDLLPHWGPGTLPAIQQFDLHVHGIFGNMAFCQTKDTGWTVDES